MFLILIKERGKPMKYKRTALIIAILAVCAPIVMIAIMLNIEEEFVEAVLGGLFFGCIVGTIFGVIALILDRGSRRKIVTILSVIPMIHIALYLVILIPFLFHDENRDKNYNTSEPTEVVSSQQSESQTTSFDIAVGSGDELSTSTNGEKMSDEEIRNIYVEALDKLYNSCVFPDGMTVDYEPYNNAIPDNYFAIYDVDMDGYDELILNFRNAPSTSEVSCRIYDYDCVTGKIILQGCFYQADFYSNGNVIEPISHNQGLAGDFWPYMLHQYDASNDIWNKVGFVDAWDGNLHPEDSFHNKPFPDDLDIDRDKMLYCIDNYDIFVDGAEYTEWYNTYMEDAVPVDLDYRKIVPSEYNSIENAR